MSMTYKLEYFLSFLGVVGSLALVGYLLSLLGEKKLKWLCVSWLIFNLGWYIYYFPNYD